MADFCDHGIDADGCAPCLLVRAQKAEEALQGADILLGATEVNKQTHELFISRINAALALR